MTYRERAQKEHITNCPKVLDLLEQADDEIARLKYANSIYEVTDPSLKVDIGEPVPGILRRQAGDCWISDLDKESER